MFICMSSCGVVVVGRMLLRDVCGVEVRRLHTIGVKPAVMSVIGSCGSV